ncbi:hypothetical protein M2132_001073 [Dysgonomonas sp. PH5-45]|uniref:hypothetical protein n=1 Tax=unclassified Dysgonomonas TaxID=2630389 RepID=UPI0024732328|nr:MULTISPECIES: hypothetical protein [unclassified Dysgonomonas]MDH6354744.1 hypothetical protein [Dysgonomonas sp. PH5-45]MDH6387643.1 hypothetical protein [Dysgonomonas sp. PH5-37]
MEEKDKKQIVTRIEEPVFTEQVPDLADPGPGKAWKRKYDSIIFYGNLYFGYTSHLKKNRKETENDFELVDVEDISP